MTEVERRSVPTGTASFRARAPGPALAEFVELFWSWDGYAPPRGMERRLPTGTLELVVNLRADRLRVYDPDDTGRARTLSGSVVSGPHSGHFVIDTACQASMVGVHFRPGGARPFLPLPADRLRDLHVSVPALWGRGGR